MFAKDRKETKGLSCAPSAFPSARPSQRRRRDPVRKGGGWKKADCEGRVGKKEGKKTTPSVPNPPIAAKPTTPLPNPPPHSQPSLIKSTLPNSPPRFHHLTLKPTLPNSPPAPTPLLLTPPPHSQTHPLLNPPRPVPPAHFIYQIRPGRGSQPWQRLRSPCQSFH